MGPIVVLTLSLSTSLFGPVLLVYVAWYALFDRDPWKGGGNRVNDVLKNRLYLPEHIRDYFPQELHKEADLDPENGPYLMGLHPHGIICYSHFVNVLTDVTGFKSLFPSIDRRIATLNIIFLFPFIRELALIHGLISVEKSSIKYWLSRGRNKAVGVVIGGAAESLECFEGTNRIVLKKRKGFFKVALETGFGETSLWNQMSHPVLYKLQKALLRLCGFTIPLAYGRWYTLIPRRQRVVTVVGKPIPVTKTENPTSTQIDELQAQYIQALQNLYDRYKDEYDKDRKEDLKIVG
ncbi:hypothetical protein SpCBS45565_g03683 [Spizellomyces sp. 'palustris']|nr:hypothetical protein SpCBS45565_g03683 [Spizellomyces sp. 'palustris']